MSISNAIQIRGHIRAVEFDETGDTRVLYDDPNHVVNGHLSTLALLVSQISPALSLAELAINSMMIESSSTPLPPVTPNDAGPQGSVALDYVFDRNIDVTVNAGSVQYRAYLDPTDPAVDGLTIRAVGLYTQGDGSGGGPVLMNRQIITSFVKQPGLGVRFEWNVRYIIVTP